ncbi:MAG TPA: cobalamin-independent methionine synthase II family protein [Stellaceae bacterium]|jgi:5-methyltetrahydropteroyltriglutamate--homocysteine methyltransferase|nr:cobalamin-independent methionine synthase II family protein [Stellaceae bacterium]
MSPKIRTTHVGSLPRPEQLVPFLRARHQHQPIDEAAFAAACRQAVFDCVARQVASGVDIVSDGEMAKISYAYYVQDRLSGLESADVVAQRGETLRRFQTTGTFYPEFPDYTAARMASPGGPASAKPPVCTGPLSYRDAGPVNGDLALLKEAAGQAHAPSCFMTAASPGVIAMFASETSYYATEDDYVFALAEAMKQEYAAIAQAGVTLQIDCPDLPIAKRMKYASGDVDYRRIIARNIEAANIAIGDIPGDRVRLHLCWGNYAGPHTHDLDVAELFPLLRQTKARALSFEAANPRHEHEWEDWRNAGLPDDMVLIPGVIDSVTNFVEHPRLVSQRLRRFVDAVGAERVIAGADCGFGTFAASTPTVFPSIVWEKLRALAEGAALVR